MRMGLPGVGQEVAGCPHAVLAAPAAQARSMLAAKMFKLWRRL
jgi:hypothetical protein